jgi:hypothetical protein
MPVSLISGSWMTGGMCRMIWSKNWRHIFVTAKGHLMLEAKIKLLEVSDAVNSKYSLRPPRTSRVDPDLS